MALMDDITDAFYVNILGRPLQTEEERQRIKEETLLGEPEVEMVDSSWVEAGAYNEEQKTLTIDLIDGSEYIYFNVRPSKAEEFFSSTSKGRFINEVLKKGFYPYERVQ